MMSHIRLRALFFALLVLSAPAHALAGPTPECTENVVLILIDGLRWQEVFRGADESLMNKENGAVTDVAALRREFWRETPSQRRAALLPFLWTVVAQQGQLFGDPQQGSVVRVSNGFNFSYPGYSEMLVGFGDPRIDSNDKRPNPNITVFEWLGRKPRFAGRVAAFAAWDVVPYVFNRDRCGFFVNSGLEPLRDGPPTPTLELLNRLKAEIPPRWGSGEAFDALTFYTALEYVQQRKPRLLYLAYGETDEWAHEGNYAEYLLAARRTDLQVKLLWNTMQSLPEYRDRTTLILTADHGRGDGPQQWKNHGKDVPGAEFVWIGVLGPDTAALGVRTNTPMLTLGQVAATIARAVGEDFCATAPQAAPPIPGAIGPAPK